MAGSNNRFPMGGDPDIVPMPKSSASALSVGFVPAPAAGVSPPPPPVPGSPNAVKEEAMAIGRKWGELLADRDIALDALQTKHAGVSVWDRMPLEERQAFIKKIQDQFAFLPALPQVDMPPLVAAQDEGFAIGVQSGYSAEKLNAFLVKLGSELAIFLFSGLASRGVRLPRFIMRVIKLPVLPPAIARTAAEAEALVARVRSQSGQVVYNVGGRGAPGEPQGAINVNPEELPGGIPNQVAGWTKDAGCGRTEGIAVAVPRRGHGFLAGVDCFPNK